MVPTSGHKNKPKTRDTSCARMALDLKREILLAVFVLSLKIIVKDLPFGVYKAKKPLGHLVRSHSRGKQKATANGRQRASHSSSLPSFSCVYDSSFSFRLILFLSSSWSATLSSIPSHARLLSLIFAHLNILSFSIFLASLSHHSQHFNITLNHLPFLPPSFPPHQSKPSSD